MTNTEHTFDSNSDAFAEGMGDGYSGFSIQERFRDNEDYLAGYAAGNSQWNDDEAAAEQAEYYDDYDPWNPVEQGMYDDDPNPYNGTY